MGSVTATELEKHSETMDERVVPCHVCGGLEFSLLLAHKDLRAEAAWLQKFYASRSNAGGKDLTNFTQQPETNIVKCLGCGTVLRNPQPTPEALADLYKNDPYGLDTLEKLFESEKHFFREKAEGFRLPASARVLEIGSFVGAFLHAAIERGWDACGIDIGEETAAFCRGRGHRVLGTIQDLEETSYDAVFIWNTFDQMADPVGELLRLREVLKTGGLLVIRVPNGRFEDACLRIRKRMGLREHVRRAQAYNNFITFPYLNGYTADSLPRLLANCGYSCLRISGDTILTLANAETTLEAAKEEKRYKRLVMNVCRKLEEKEGVLYYPWLDAVFQMD